MKINTKSHLVQICSPIRIIIWQVLHTHVKMNFVLFTISFKWHNRQNTLSITDGSDPESNIFVPDPERRQTCFISILNMCIFLILRSAWSLGLLTLLQWLFWVYPNTQFSIIAKTQLQQKVEFWRHMMWLNISNEECVWLVAIIVIQ